MLRGAAVKKLVSQLRAGGSNNRIGGVNSGEGNVISGNSYYGIDLIAYLGDICASNEVLGNYIGTDATGMSVLGNGSGVDLAGCTGPW